MPTLEIEKVGNGSIEIVNYSGVSGNSFKLSNLVNGEKVTVDCLNEEVTSNIPLIYHFDDVSGEYPSLVPGDNFVRIVGNCNVVWKYQCVFDQC
ncbi:hypothetical protein [Saccharibacillus brassicae]|uniref:hypothetical protein n=1 Tax=Saccharibacillus brassicae TaxID=2583377 RepID=UPI003CCC7B8A